MIVLIHDIVRLHIYSDDLAATLRYTQKRGQSFLLAVLDRLSNAA